MRTPLNTARPLQVAMSLMVNPPKEGEASHQQWADERAATLASLWLAGRLRPITPDQEISTTQAIAAAAEGMYDADEPVM